MIGDAYMTCEAGYPCDDPGVVAADDVDGDLSAFVDVAGSVNTEEMGEYVLVYTVTNTAGQSATETRTVVVVDTIDACDVPRCVEGRCEDLVRSYRCVCKPGYVGESCDVQACSLLDSDADGTNDCLDACDRDPHKQHVGACGCGKPETDTDFDGVPDCVDECPSDAGKAEPGVCGCGTSDADEDGDGEADCLQRLPCLHGWSLGSKLCYRAVELGQGGSSRSDDDSHGPGWQPAHAACAPGFLAVIRDAGQNSAAADACKATSGRECWIAARADAAGDFVWPGTPGAACSLSRVRGPTPGWWRL